MFADRGADYSLLPLMAQSGFAGAMLDTAGKDTGSLLDQMDIAALKNFVDTCRQQGLWAGLAGSLEAPDIPRLLLLEPDYLGFRRALCGQQRTAAIDPGAVRVIRDLIPLDARSVGYHRPDASKVDYRLLAARGYSFDPNDEAVTDRVLVRDFVVPGRIGAYAREHDKPQNIRFNVDVRVLRPGHAPEDMRDVFSYDVITDGIRMIVAQEHIPLVETLAERVASLLLSDARVREVRVRVEKLDVGPGAVGIEIRRERPAEVAEVHRLFPLRESDPKAAE
jgi:dihydroneopterin aldolase